MIFGKRRNKKEDDKDIKQEEKVVKCTPKYGDYRIVKSKISRYRVERFGLSSYASIGVTGSWESLGIDFTTFTDAKIHIARLLENKQHKEDQEFTEVVYESWGKKEDACDKKGDE